MPQHLLTAIVLLPLAGAIAIAIAGRGAMARAIGCAVALAGAAATVPVWLRYDPAGTTWQLVERVALLPSLGVSYAVGVDGYAIALLAAASVVVFLAMAIAPIEAAQRDRLRACGLLLHAAVAGAVVSLDLSLFAFCWCAAMAALVALTGAWMDRRLVVTVSASVSALLVVAGVLMLHAAYRAATGTSTFDVVRFLEFQFPADVQRRVWIAWTLGFAGLVPLMPAHGWARAAARTASPAGLLLVCGLTVKLGLFGVMRFALPLLPGAAAAWGRPLAWWGMATAVVAFGLALREREWRGLAACLTVACSAAAFATLFRLTPGSSMASVLQQAVQPLLLAVCVAIGARLAAGSVEGARPALVPVTPLRACAAAIVALALAALAPALVSRRPASLPAFTRLVETSVGRVIARVDPSMAPLVKQPSDCGAGAIASTALPAPGAATWVIATPCADAAVPAVQPPAPVRR